MCYYSALVLKITAVVGQSLWVFICLDVLYSKNISLVLLLCVCMSYDRGCRDVINLEVWGPRAQSEGWVTYECYQYIRVHVFRVHVFCCACVIHSNCSAILRYCSYCCVSIDRWLLASLFSKINIATTQQQVIYHVYPSGSSYSHSRKGIRWMIPRKQNNILFFSVSSLHKPHCTYHVDGTDILQSLTNAATAIRII